MKNILLLALLYPVISFGQREVRSNNYDSLGKMQGYWELPSFLNYQNDKRHYGGVEGHEYGLFYDNQKVGVWYVYNSEHNLIGHRVYVNDTTEFEVQYRNGKIFSIIKTKLGPWQKLNEANVRLALEQEIISFNKRGKIRSKKIWTVETDDVLKELVTN